MQLKSFPYTGIIIVAVITIVSSCRKNNTEPFPQFDVITLKNAKAGDTVSYNLTIESGHRELPEVIIPSKHGRFSAISRDPSSGWYIFKYNPEAGFLGVDSVIFKSIEPVEKLTLYTHLDIIVRQ